MFLPHSGHFFEPYVNWEFLRHVFNVCECFYILGCNFLQVLCREFENKILIWMFGNCKSFGLCAAHCFSPKHKILIQFPNARL